MRRIAPRAVAAPPSSLLASRSRTNSPEKLGFGRAAVDSLAFGRVGGAHFSLGWLSMPTIFTMKPGKALSIVALVCCCVGLAASPTKPRFKVVAFFTGKEDAAHISFLHEAVASFPEMAAKNNFSFDTTSDWRNLNATFLARYQVVVFLDTRPEDSAQRAAFQSYMEHGGAWMGFHFAGFALTPSAYPSNWDWYHNTFLGAGSYVSNTWRPVSAILRVEDRKHPSTPNLPETF